MIRSPFASLSRGLRSAKSRARDERFSRPQVESLEDRCLLSATWTQFFPGNGQGTFNDFPSTFLLLSNGKIMINGDNNNQWYTLSPDASGSYTNGSITHVASASASRLYFGSVVLPSGKVMVLGGEYFNNGSPDTNPTGQIYDPVANTWTNIASYPTGHFGDDTLTLLPNGTVMGTSIFDSQIYAYNPGSNSWSPLASKLNGDASDEEGFVKLPPTASLPQGGILSYDIFASASTYPGGGNTYLPPAGTTGLAQYYDVSGNTWNQTNTVPANVRLTSSAVPNQGNPDFNFYELGPGVLLPSNGKVLFIGATPDYNNAGTATSGAHTGLYDPATNSWTAGPDLPLGYANDDGPAAVLPDGNVIFTADIPYGNTPTKLLEYNPGTNQITDLTPSLPAQLQFEMTQVPGFAMRMIVAPSGQMLLTTTFQFGGGMGGELWAYSETGTVNAAWKPKITNITNNSPGVFTLTGQQLNGLDEGSSYGDDVQNATNYPIVRLTNTATGKVYYATTTNWSQPGEVATGTQVGTTTFTLPASLTSPGNYVVAVIANGIASNPAIVFISAGQIGSGSASVVTGLGQAPLAGAVSAPSAVGVGLQQASHFLQTAGVARATGFSPYSNSPAASDAAFARVGNANQGLAASTGLNALLTNVGATYATGGSLTSAAPVHDDLFTLAVESLSTL